MEDMHNSSGKPFSFHSSLFLYSYRCFAPSRSSSETSWQTNQTTRIPSVPIQATSMLHTSSRDTPGVFFQKSPLVTVPRQNWLAVERVLGKVGWSLLLPWIIKIVLTCRGVGSTWKRRVERGGSGGNHTGSKYIPRAYMVCTCGRTRSGRDHQQMTTAYDESLSDRRDSRIENSGVCHHLTQWILIPAFEWVRLGTWLLVRWWKVSIRSRIRS